MNKKIVKCPNCGYEIEVEINKKYAYCIECGNKIILDNALEDLLIKETLEDYISRCKNLLKEHNYNKLKETAITMLGKWQNSFWPYAFLSIAETEIDFINDIPFNKHVMSQDEINDDIKSRIYFAARRKYISSTQGVFDSLSKYYPDTPATDGSNSWQKCPTSYERNVALISSFFTSITLIKSKYLQNMEKFAQNDEEFQVISNFKKWETNVINGKKELENYNKVALDFVNEDFKNTPKPGNKFLFSLYLTLFVVSLSLLVLSISGLVFGILFSFMSLFSKVFYVMASCFMAIATTHLIFSRKLFLPTRVISSIAIIVIVVVTIVLGANGVFFAQMDNTYGIYFYIMSIIFSTIVSFISGVTFIKNRIRKVSVNKTYIGDLSSLLKNNFDVQFDYEFKKD